MMPRRCRVEVVPKEIFVRVYILALGGVGFVRETITRRIGHEADEERPDVQPVQLDLNALRRQHAHRGIEIGVQLGAVIRRGSETRCASNRRHVWHDEFTRARRGEPAHQHCLPRRGCGHVRRAIVVEKIVGAAPHREQRCRIDRAPGEVIVDLFAHVIDRDREVLAKRSDDGVVRRAIFGRRAAEGEIVAAVEAGRCYRHV